MEHKSVLNVWHPLVASLAVVVHTFHAPCLLFKSHNSHDMNGIHIILDMNKEIFKGMNSYHPLSNTGK